MMLRCERDGCHTATSSSPTPTMSLAPTAQRSRAAPRSARLRSVHRCSGVIAQLAHRRDRIGVSEARSARHDDTRTGLDDASDISGVDPPVDLELAARVTRVDQGPRFTQLFDRVLQEFLAAETRIDAHDQE